VISRWTTYLPLAALVALAATFGRDLAGPIVVLVSLLLAGAVLAAVHHAEVVAHRVGEPYGSLILAVAVTVIEVALIVTLMVSGGEKAQSLARDTVFAAVMITCNGIVGLSLLLGSVRHGLPRFNPEGTGAAVAVVATLVTITLVLPRFTTGASGGRFTGSQLAFVAIAAVAIYAVFITTQTRRHRDFFLPVNATGKLISEDDHAEIPGLTVKSIPLLMSDPSATAEMVRAGLELAGVTP
jgi:Ca2+:H+ antiporter